MVLARLPASHVWSVRLSIAVAEPTVSTKPSTLKYVHKAIPDALSLFALMLRLLVNK